MKEKRKISVELDNLPFGEEELRNTPTGLFARVPVPAGASGGKMTVDTVRFLWPTFLELLLTQLTTVVSQIMVGRLPGEEGISALAAVGLAGQPKLLLMTMIQGINVGVTTVIARFRGQRDQKEMDRTFKLAILFNLLLSSLFMLLGLVGARGLISLMTSKSISDTTMNYAVTYLRIQMYGFIPLGISITVTAALRGVGETRIPMIYNLVSNVLNVVFGYLLIYGNLGFPRLGIIGASWALVIGQMVAFLISMWASLSGLYSISLRTKDRFIYEGGVLRDIVSIGIPNMVEQLFMRLGLMIYSRLISGLGDVAYATHQVANSVQMFAYSVGQAFTSTSAALTGQSIGKKRYDMAVLYTRITRLVALAFSCSVMILSILFSKTIVSWYNKTPEIIEMGHVIIIMIAISLPIQTDQTATVGSLRGAGDTIFSAVVTLLTVVVIRNLLGILFVKSMGYGLVGAWMALIIDQSLRSILVGARYHQGRWKWKET